MAQVSANPYNVVARWLHWGIALLILSLLMGGFLMTHLDIPSDQKFKIYQVHKSFGLIILVLSVARLIWRVTHRVPPLPDTMAPWQKVVARATHWVFYILIIGIPLSGWVMVSTSLYDIPTKLFFLVPIPHLPVGKSESLSALAHSAHWWMAFSMAALLVVHIGAALKHHIADRDDVLLRMAPEPRNALGKVGRLAFAAYAAMALAVFWGAVLILGDGEPDATKTSVAQPDVQPQRESDAPAASETDFAWIIDPEKTAVRLTGTAFGSEFTATIPDVAATIMLDPDNPSEVGSIFAMLNLASMTGGSDAVSTLTGSAWFDVANHAIVTFESDGIVGTEEGACLARGMLTIKGVGTPLSLPFALDFDETGRATALGRVIIDRSALRIGPPGGGIDPEVIVDVVVVADLAP